MKRTNTKKVRMEQSRRPKKNPLHKIRSRRVTGLTPQQQRQVATAVKNAREMALLPFTSR